MIDIDPAGSLCARSPGYSVQDFTEGHMVCFKSNMGLHGGEQEDLSPTLMVDRENAVASNMMVRRLMPEECELLQGFPMGYTRIPWRNKDPKDCPDGPRYKALGNSMAVPCMRFIGERIQMIKDQHGR